VWVEFEAGDVSRPIWVGCWWSSDKLPTDEAGTAATPDVKITRSEEGLMLALHDDSKSIALSDTDGKNLVLIEVEDGKITIKADSKVIIEAPAIELVDGAEHTAVFGDLLEKYLKKVVDGFNSHMHPGQQAGPYPVVPKKPASPISAPSSDLQSTKVKLG
jgi:uncharacterized protein involved in type VI secretion and phage assembly